MHAGGVGGGGRHTCRPSHKNRAGVPGTAIILAATTTCKTTYDHLWARVGAQRLDRHQLIRADTHTRSRTPGGPSPKTPALKPNYPVEPVSFQRPTVEDAGPPIRDTCVPSHVIEAGFLENDASLQRYGKTNRFKDMTAVFVNRNAFHGAWKSASCGA